VRIEVALSSTSLDAVPSAEAGSKITALTLVFSGRDFPENTYKFRFSEKDGTAITAIQTVTRYAEGAMLSVTVDMSVAGVAALFSGATTKVTIYGWLLDETTDDWVCRFPQVIHVAPATA